MNFQEYLINKGFKRYREGVENYESYNLSTYNTIEYRFIHPTINKTCFWGLIEYGKPPVMFLGVDKMKVVSDSKKTLEDGYRILFSKEKHLDKIYNIFLSDNLYFEIIDLNNTLTINIREK